MGEEIVRSRHHYSERAERLRRSLPLVEDPITRTMLKATIEALEEAAGSVEPQIRVETP
jgi:hypothetical protein